MKKHILFLVMVCLSYTTQAIDASISFATFKSPQQSYVEVYLTIIGQTIDYQSIDSLNYQGAVQVTLVFKKNGEIIKFDKYDLSGPVTTKAINFLDLKRYALDNGEYDLEISLQDLVDTENKQSYNTKLSVDFDEKRLLQSDIQLLSAYKKTDDNTNPFTKNGYYLEPLPFNFYDKHKSTLLFYNEIYNSDKILSDDFLVSYSVERIRGNGVVDKAVMIGHKRRSPKAVNILLLQMDISQLASGNYRLLIDIRDREKNLLNQKTVVFQRSNPYLDEDPENTADFDINETFAGELDAEELKYSLRALAPIIQSIENERLNYILKSDKIERKRNFLFSYWTKRSANHPEVAYKKYMEVVRAVDKKYASGFGYGFESDRGYTFLKYGKPNESIAVHDEPDAPPYEIWVYHNIEKGKQNNVKFLFYNPSLAAGQYILLHSTARGEVNNPQWQLELYRDVPTEIDGANHFDATSVTRGLNRNAARLFSEL